MLVVMLVGASCGRAVDAQTAEPGTNGTLPDLATDPDAPYPPAIVAAIERLAEELGRAPQAIEVVSYEEIEWPDGCLGRPNPNEVCTEAITPGWRVILSLAGEIHIFRADAVGAELREE